MWYSILQFYFKTTLQSGSFGPHGDFHLKRLFSTSYFVLHRITIIFIIDKSKMSVHLHE